MNEGYSQALENDIKKELRIFFDAVKPDSLGNTQFRNTAGFGMWTGALSEYRNLLLKNPLSEALRVLEFDGGYYIGPKNTWPMGHLFFEDLLEYLKEIGFDLDSAPEDIAESGETDPRFLYTVNGRKVSIDFLFKLVMAHRTRDVLEGEGARVFEIGAGMGRFARVAKALNPSIHYIILDLFEVMVLGYVYLRVVFPDAKFQFIYDPSQLSNIDLDNDFLFIASEIFEPVEKWHIDLAINTFSLGEMSQQMVNQHIDLLENKLDVKRFYSFNFYLQPERSLNWHNEMIRMSNSTPVDCNWRVRHWGFTPPVIKQFLHRDEAQYLPGGEPQSLELYLERTPGQASDPEALRRRSDALLSEANTWKTLRGNNWHRLMWESIQLCPRVENVRPYYEFLQQHDMREQRYYGKLLGQLGVNVPEPYTKSWRPTPGPMRRKFVSFLRKWTNRGFRVLEWSKSQ